MGGSIQKMNVGVKIAEMGSGQRIVNSDHSPEKKRTKWSLYQFLFKKIFYYKTCSIIFCGSEIYLLLVLLS